ncbi:RNA-binding protein (RRM superfamily) [Phaffia rhodozyma]|uniref:RNA-binding protein (RRM superfamily) n=1 Tax=Phaffia rhodozyma TaxID=264483 RepID=A0A0F7SPT4_PHARH|nr:RNA-binding protein (RRM superfamily) [Phaffia rhodozyma]
MSGLFALRILSRYPAHSIPSNPYRFFASAVPLANKHHDQPPATILPPPAPPTMPTPPPTPPPVAPEPASVSSSSGLFIPDHAPHQELSPQLPPKPFVHSPSPDATPVSSPTQKKASTESLPGLARTLGVPERPEAKEITWLQALVPSLDSDFRKAKLQAILAEFGRSNLRNIKEAASSRGGKGWLAPKTLFKEEKALYLPNLYGKTLAHPETKTHTTDICQGKITVLSILGTIPQARQCEAFVKAVRTEYKDEKDLIFCSVSLQNLPVKAWMQTFFISNLREIVPKDQHDNYIISTQNLKSSLEDEMMGIVNNLAGYVYLVDENLKIRWAGCGDSTVGERNSLLLGTTLLLDRLKANRKVEAEGSEPKKTTSDLAFNIIISSSSMSTRIILLNLPPTTTPESLRSHLSSASASAPSSSTTPLPPPGSSITDLKLLSRRRFAFVGYRSSDEAQRAVHWWNGAWLEGSRLKAELVDDSKASTSLRPNHLPTPESRPLKRPSSPPASTREPVDQPGTSKRLKKSSSAKDKNQKEEFIQLATSKRASTAVGGRSWEDLPPDEAAAAATDAANSGVNKIEPVPEVEEQKNDGDAEMDDSEWMKKMMSGKVKDEVETEGDNLSAEDKLKKVEVVHADGRAVDGSQEEQTPQDMILSTSRLFLRNLPFSCTDLDLRQLLSPFGSLASVHLPHSNSVPPKPLGTAYVLFDSNLAALAAWERLDGSSFMGRLLHILPGRAPLGGTTDSEDKSLKDKRKEKKKADAMGEGREFEWGFLFMNSDAVVSSIADRMNISKADILNSESGNAAVKLALAETHVIQETKQYFEEEGLLLDSLSPSTPRSPTILLVKNIPYGTTHAMLTEMFAAHGEIVRLLLPPAGTMAIVEFVDAVGARAAFKALAYKRMGNSIMYLEKGPKGLFNGVPKAKTVPAVASDTSDATVVKDDDETAVSRTAAPNATLFIKNLNFTTTSALLTSTFSHLASFSFARVQTKPDPKRPGQKQSMGFGFVGFGSAEAAQAAKAAMHGFKLEGHALEVGFAKRGTDDDDMEGTDDKKEGGKKGWRETTTKMVVKNIPFEATKKDIRELFTAYAQVKSVRLPKKFNAQGRGFAFLDFFSRREAEAAMAALKHTHLLGRHLVLEWAEEDLNLDKLREDAAEVKRANEEPGGAEKRGKKTKVVM